MAGLAKRLGLIFKSKASKALDRVEDPRETLDYSYERQLEMLQKVRRGVADVATSRKRLEIQLGQLRTQSDRLTTQATQAVAANREDLAREALTRRGGLATQVQDLELQHAGLKDQEEKLVEASRRLQAKVDAFKTRKETVKATYTAAQAQTSISEAFSGLSEEMGDVNLAIERAEDRTAAMQARSGAIDELLESGALSELGGRRDDIQLELDRIGAGSDVELELARIKGQIAPAPATKAITADAQPSEESR